MATEKARFELKVGEIYKSLEKGLSDIETSLGSSEQARFSNLPNALLERLIASYKGPSKKLELFFRDEGQQEDIQKQKDSGPFSENSALLTSHWYQNFVGEKMHMGEVITSDGLWHILYKDDGTPKRITANTDRKSRADFWQKNYMMRLERDHLYATVYDRIEGLDEIRKAAQKAEVFRVTVVPPYLLKDLIVPAKQGDYRFILSRRDPLAKFFQDDTKVRYASRARIYYVYGEEEASVGSLRLDSDYYSVFWRGNEVYSVMKLNNRIWANILARVFDTSWKYSEKV